MKRNREEEICERSKILKPHRNRAGKFPNVPCEVIEEILQKLPVKSLMRFKSVSKQWRSMIGSHEFVEKHMNHQKSRDRKILVTSSTEDPYTNLSVESISIGEEEAEEEIYSSFFTLSDRFSHLLEVSESCDGLVCIYGMKMPIYVLNPATRELRKLPPARYTVGWRKYLRSPVGFGRDIVTGTYKVVQISTWFGSFEETVALCDIFDLSMNTWRQVSMAPYHIYPEQKLMQNPVYTCGSLYWIVGENYVEKKILAMDLHTEEFHLVQHPDCLLKRVRDPMFSLKDRLCVLKRNLLPWTLDIWAMDGRDERWEKIYSFRLFSGFDNMNACRDVTPLIVSCKKERLVVRMFGDVVTLDLKKKDQRIACRRRQWGMAAYCESLVSPFK